MSHSHCGEETFTFERIVLSGCVVNAIAQRAERLVECAEYVKLLSESKEGIECNEALTFADIYAHKDWLCILETGLSGARARIECEFKIASALALKVREGRRKCQLTRRLDILRQQCDVLNQSIKAFSEHCTWFRDSNTLKDALLIAQVVADNSTDSLVAVVAVDNDIEVICHKECSSLRADATKENAGNSDSKNINVSELAVSGKRKRKSRKRKKEKRQEDSGSDECAIGDASPKAMEEQPEIRERRDGFDFDHYDRAIRWLRRIPVHSNQLVDVWAVD
eukprot:GEMP01077516.1.p1 GENE.GEMP01077516.1~~GEMP01077516.1.p1  ORF type:complete len:280 (-),score=67.84 GEMP01077516.1:86-925(-)